MEKRGGEREEHSVVLRHHIALEWSDTTVSDRLRSPRFHFGARSLALAFLLLTAVPAHAGGPKWKLVYYRQIGQSVSDANSQVVRNFLVRENGTKAASTGLTNTLNPTSLLFGRTDFNGYLLLPPFPMTTTNVFIRDLQGTPSDITPDFYFQDAEVTQSYSYEAHWLRVTNDEIVNTYPTRPVYHYDQVLGIAGSRGDAPEGYDSDTVGLDLDGDSTEAEFHIQTFTVPPGINRIVMAKAFVVSAPGVHFSYEATIHEGGPLGDQIGPAARSRDITSPDFLAVTVNWGLQDVPVAAGSTYALRIRPVGGGTLNAYATVNNIPGVTMYYGGLEHNGHDLAAVIVGVGYDNEPTSGPSICVDPSPFEHECLRGDPVADDIIYITNTGSGRLDYSLSIEFDPPLANPWLVPDATSGSVHTETASVPFHYVTTHLKAGDYSAIIKVESTDAANSPQTAHVTLHVLPPAFVPCDFDRDEDVDMVDFGRFQRCITGSGEEQPDEECAGARLDDDNDVDLDDLARFNKCLGASGPGIPISDTACADD